MDVLQHQRWRTAPAVWGLWAVLAIAVALIAGLSTKPRSVTERYRAASLDWMHGRDMYTGPGEDPAHPSIHGFLYLPSFAVLYAPIACLPVRAGDVLWRLICVGLLAGAVYRLAGVAGPAPGGEIRGGGIRGYFPWISLLTISVAMDGARNGQMNLPLTALTIFAAADLVAKRWWRATLWLVLGLALKPLMLVLILLAAVLYPPMRWRLLAGVAAVLGLPFLAQNPGYVAAEYSSFVRKMGAARNPEAAGERFNDLMAMLGVLGVAVPLKVQTLVQAVAAAGTLVISWIGLKRWGPRRGTILMATFATCYLLLFNPRTEANTYVLLGPWVGVFACWTLFEEGRPPLAWVLVAMIVAMTVVNEVMRLVQIHMPNHLPFLEYPNNSVRPALCLVFWTCLVARVLCGRPPGSADGVQQTTPAR